MTQKELCVCGHNLEYRDSHYRNMHRASCPGAPPTAGDPGDEEPIGSSRGDPRRQKADAIARRIVEKNCYNADDTRRDPDDDGDLIEAIGLALYDAAMTGRLII